MGTDSGDCSGRSFTRCENLGMAAHPAGREASGLICAYVRTPIGLGSSWAARRPGTSVRGDFASLTSKPDHTARQRDRIRGAGPRILRPQRRGDQHSRFGRRAARPAASPHPVALRSSVCSHARRSRCRDRACGRKTLAGVFSDGTDPGPRPIF